MSGMDKDENFFSMGGSFRLRIGVRINPRLKESVSGAASFHQTPVSGCYERENQGIFPRVAGDAPAV
jgi:hypothetical protein